MYNCKMNSNMKITSNGICTYVTILVKPKATGIMLLLFVNMANAAVIYFAFTQNILALLFISLAVATFLIKYSLWNLMGKENLIISTKTITYQNDYGFFKTQYLSKELNTFLDLQSEPAMEEKGMPQYKLQFISCDERGIPVVIYTTNLPVTEQDRETLRSHINHLFIDKESDQPPIFVANLN